VDPTGDASTAPDIGNVTVTLNSACGLIVNPTVSGLNADQAVFVWINTDGNPATGETLADGADRVVDVESVGPPLMYTCTTSPCDALSETPLSGVGIAGFATDLNQLGVPSSPTTLGIVLEADHFDAQGFVDAQDFAPNGPPAYPFTVNFSTPPPPPPPPSSPPPSSTPPPAPVKSQTGCKVPNVKGKSVAKAKKALVKAKCKYKIKGKGKVVSTNPKAGKRTTGTVQVKAKAKKKRKGHSSRARFTRSASVSWAAR
jgi:hypothetical protein